MSGVSQISDVIEAAKETAGGAVQTLITVAGGLEMATTGAELRRVAAALDSDEFRLLIIGRFNNGKSTLANALLAATDRPVSELDGTEGPLVPGDLPATAVLTWVRYGTQATVTAEELTKERVTWPLIQYLADSILDGYGDDEADRERFGRLHHFDMEYPAVACKTGLIIGDSPGFSHNTDRSAITRDASKDCDAVIAVFNSAAPFGMDEMKEVEELIPGHVRVFWVVNLMNRPTADERLRASTWNKLLKERHFGEPWHGQNLADSDVFFVNARDAFYAVRAGDAEAAAASGFTRFEERIAAFYADYAVPAHVERCAGGAIGFAAEMQDVISGFLGAATADQEDFTLAYEAQLPVLAEVRTAPERIAAIIDRTRVDVSDIADTSF